MTKRILAASAAISLLTFAQTAQAEQRQLGAHEHGHGALNIAIEGNRVEIELEVPGADIVGFEHAATTPEQKAQVAEAEAQLEDALKQFVLPAAASCRLAKADVEVEAEGEHEHEKNKEAHKNHDHDQAGHKEEHKDGAHEGEEGHSEFHATYSLDCTQPDEIKSIHFAYFKSFPNAKSLSVKIVSEKQQGSYEVTADKPDLDLSGSM